MTVAPAAVSAVIMMYFFTPVGGFANAQNTMVQSRDPDVVRVARLHGKSERKELRLLLIHVPSDQHRFYESVFFYEAQLRPALLALVRDPKVGVEAVDFLASIGEPDDLQFIIRHPPRPNHVGDRWAYHVACSLVGADTEEEWLFLRKCALNKYHDGWAGAGAVQTLKLTASPRSRELLEETQRQNQYWAVQVARALEYVRSQPNPLAGSNLEELAARVAQTVKIGNWQGNVEPRYSEAGDKALVDFEFTSGRDLLFYTATFCRIRDTWRLRGVREIAQALVMAPPPAQMPDRKQ